MELRVADIGPAEQSTEHLDEGRTVSVLDVPRVGVVCPLAVVQQRERSRADRTLGWACAHYDVIHRYLPYDLTVDTSRADPSGCAEAVIAELARRSPIGSCRPRPGQPRDR